MPVLGSRWCDNLYSPDFLSSTTFFEENFIWDLLLPDLDGDVSINKKMKTYVNTFYSILNQIEKWELMDLNQKKHIINTYLNVNKKSLVLAEYFENYISYLKKNTFNSLIKGVIKPNF